MLKKYPTDYNNEVLTILRAMSFTDGKEVKLVGSYTLRNQIYAGDVDSIETVPVKSVHDIVHRFQSIVKDLIKIPFTYVSDIKCGSIEEWRVVPDTISIHKGKVIGYDNTSILTKVEHLHATKIISNEQFMKAKQLLKKNVTAEEFIELQKELRYNIIRWDFKEIIIGYKLLQDGSRYTLEEAVQAPTITKMDIVSWIDGNHFMDFEMIYVFKIGSRVVNKELGNCDIAIKKSVLSMRREKNYFKMAKRMHVLARFNHDNKTLEVLNGILLSDLGRLYNIYGDANSLKFLIENVKYLPTSKIAFEIDHFISRLSNVVIPEYLTNEKIILSIIHRLHNKDIYTYDNSTMIELLNQLRYEIFSILSKNTLRYLKANKLYPLASKYLL